MTPHPIVGYPNETLYQVFERMSQNHISHLPIVRREDPDRMVGFLAIHNIASTYDLKLKAIKPG